MQESAKESNYYRQMSDLTNYNPSQREAVTFGEGPLLVLAGPLNREEVAIARVWKLILKV